MLTMKDAIAAKIDVTYGTDPTPSGASNAILVSSLDVRPMQQTLVDRSLNRAFLGGSEQLPASIYSEVEFEVELAGSGAAGTAPAYDCLLLACGFSKTVVASTSVTYAPLSASFPSCTIYAYKDGVLHKLVGCRGTFQLSMPNQGIPRLKFTFWGRYATPTDASISSPSYSGFVKPVIVNRTNTTPFSLHSYAAKTASLEITLGNKLAFRDLINYTSSSENVLITDRQMTGSIVLENVTMATKNFFSSIETATTGALSVQHGQSAGNICTISAPVVQCLSPSYSDSDGVAMLNMALRLNPSSGNDEISIAFT